MSHYLFSKIKQIEKNAMYFNRLDDEDVDFLFLCAKKSKDERIVMAALIVLTESNDLVLNKLTDSFFDFSDHVQQLMIPMLACVDSPDTFMFLLTVFESTTNAELFIVVKESLISTYFTVMPLIVSRLIHDDEDVLKRYKLLISDMGLASVMRYFVTLPAIPHEMFFRDVFGDKEIDLIKQKI